MMVFSRLQRLQNLVVGEYAGADPMMLHLIRLSTFSLLSSQTNLDSVVTFSCWGSSKLFVCPLYRCLKVWAVSPT